MGLRRGAFTCVGWQVTLCDPIWQATSRSCEMEYPLTSAIRSFNLHFYRYLVTSDADLWPISVSTYNLSDGVDVMSVNTFCCQKRLYPALVHANAHALHLVEMYSVAF